MFPGWQLTKPGLQSSAQGPLQGIQLTWSETGIIQRRHLTVSTVFGEYFSLPLPAKMCVTLDAWPSVQTYKIIKWPLTQKAGFRKGRRIRDQIAKSVGSSKKQESSRKNIYFCFIDYAKAFDCVDHNKLWKILQEMGIPDHLTCLLRNLYAGQEATVRTGHGTTDWF